MDPLPTGGPTVILHGDCRQQLATLPDCSVDAIVTDPPYELGFMGKKWDASGIAYDHEVWTQCLRVLKPGGHLCAFGGTRTYHRMTCAIEDAGFEIRDSLHWLYGSGFPKSLDVSKAIDKAAGAKREVLGQRSTNRNRPITERWDKSARPATSIGIPGQHADDGIVVDVTAPATDAAVRWAGWGTALKPAHEPIVLARKPLVGTVATNVMEYGTGALNIDATRVPAPDGVPQFSHKGELAANCYGDGLHGSTSLGTRDYATGRWPANILLTHGPECADECAPGCPIATLDAQSGQSVDGVAVNRNGHDPARRGYAGGWGTDPRPDQTYGGAGGASRYFATTTWDPELDVPFLYVAKPSRLERNAGLDGMPEQVTNQATPPGTPGAGSPRPGANRNGATANFHPTVKPVALIRYLIRLITPPDGTVLDPFLGSGTTAVAAILEGRQWIGCELTDDYLPIIEARVAHARTIPIQQDLFA